MFILLFSIFVALIIVVFAVQNASIVPVQFFIWSTDLPFVLVIFCSVFAGALLMFCLALRHEVKRKKIQKSNSVKTTPIQTKDTTEQFDSQQTQQNEKSDI